MGIIRTLSAQFVALLLVVAGPAAAQPAVDEASLRAADQEQRRLVFESDAEELAKMLHPNMLINGPTGRVVTRDMFLESVRSGAIAKERFERHPEAVRITGPVGVLVGHEIVVASPGSRDFATYGASPFQRRYVNVFLFENGRWLFLARQASVVASAAEANEPTGP